LLIALGIVLLIVTSAHAYFIQRLVLDPHLVAPWSTLVIGVIIGLAALLFIYPFMERRFGLGPAASRVLGWPAYLWLGTCFYLLLALGLSDLLLAILGIFGIEREPWAAARALCVAVVVATVVVFGVWTALRGPVVKRVELTLAGWPAGLDGYRIVQISDVHIGSLLGRRFASKVTQYCNALKPDLVAVTGDLVDGSVARLESRVAPFSALRGRDGVFFVTGNHDHYSGADGWTAKLKQFGFEVLRNRRVPIAREAGRFELAGVDDHSARRRSGSGTGDVDVALAGWSRDGVVVLLAHDPRTFDEARRCGVDLQLSGHTHAGQRWPFQWLVRLQTRYVVGRYQSGGSQLYVSRGTGFWGPPLRIFAPGEITELLLHSPAG
jgi:hypothetical protein